MITAQALYDYFDREYETAREEYIQLMRLPLPERIRKRKAVDQVLIVGGKAPWKQGRDIFFQVTVPRNISDFKEGDIVRLHPEEESRSLECTLYGFEGEHDMVLCITSFVDSSLIHRWVGRPLVMDRSLIDLREHVYYRFIADQPSESSWWDDLLVNSRKEPSFRPFGECESALKEMEEALEIRLNPRQREAVLKSMAAEDYYMIQGPPGTGKSFILGLVILQELFYSGRRVAVIGPNHLAVNNVLQQLLKTIPSYSDRIFKIGQPYNAPAVPVCYEGEERRIHNIPRMSYMGPEVFSHSFIVGMTPHTLYTSRARDLVFDTLVIDEAGQMPVPLALMGMVKAQKVIFAGDHRQLPPIINADGILPELKQSVFQLLATRENCTMLEESFRMNEGICRFVSDLFYDGKVRSSSCENEHPDCSADEILDFAHPVVLKNVADEGMQTSELEAEQIAEMVETYLRRGISSDEIGVLTPFRAQASCIRRALRKMVPQTMKENPVVVETIDKMQGQEREIIIVSFAAGDLEYMKEMGDFLYNPQKMNVAFSRARSKLILVCHLEHLRELSPDDFPYVDRILHSDYLKIF